MFTLAESLGGVESLANHRLDDACFHTRRKRKEAGITDDLVRLV
jgi:cystathionine beta-lyase/cystathionine gamma-synthase